MQSFVVKTNVKNRQNHAIKIRLARVCAIIWVFAPLIRREEFVCNQNKTRRTIKAITAGAQMCVKRLACHLNMTKKPYLVLGLLATMTIVVMQQPMTLNLIKQSGRILKLLNTAILSLRVVYKSMFQPAHHKAMIQRILIHTMIRSAVMTLTCSIRLYRIIHMPSNVTKNYKFC